MGIDFHSKAVGSSYATREADSSWREKITGIVDIKGKTIVDIGCGGGIYTKAFADLGASNVIGVDFSHEQLAQAAKTCESFDNITFQYGSADQTGLTETYDIVFEKAVIHHVTELVPLFQEAFSRLKPGGLFIVQDRTVEDCLLPGSANHIRGYFFDEFPELSEKEKIRRHTDEYVIKELQEVGFKRIQSTQLWETRKHYLDKGPLLQDLSKRTGRSLLFELTEQQLEQLITRIDQKLPAKQEIVEKDRWSIWIAMKE